MNEILKGPGNFCRLIGVTIRNRVLEFFLEAGELDYGFGDVAVELHVSRSGVFNAVRELQDEGIIKVSRRLKNKTMYVLNKDNVKTRFLIKMFKESLHTHNPYM